MIADVFTDRAASFALQFALHPSWGPNDQTIFGFPSRRLDNA